MASTAFEKNGYHQIMKYVGKIVKKEFCNKTYREISEFFKKILADVVVHIQTLLACVLSHSVVSDSLWPYGLQPTRLLCPWGFSRQEYWSGLPCPPPGDLPNPGIKPRSPALQADSLPTEPPGKPCPLGLRRIDLEQIKICLNLKQIDLVLHSHSIVTDLEFWQRYMSIHKLVCMHSVPPAPLCASPALRRGSEQSISVPWCWVQKV